MGNEEKFLSTNAIELFFMPRYNKEGIAEKPVNNLSNKSIY